jgi:hypothetical protein
MKCLPGLENGRSKPAADRENGHIDPTYDTSKSKTEHEKRDHEFLERRIEFVARPITAAGITVRALTVQGAGAGSAGRGKWLRSV